MSCIFQLSASKSRFNLNHNWISSALKNRSYFTGTRYTGYVSYFHDENLFGFVCRDDVPEREYYFHVTDLHAESIPRVRPLQTVEFGVMEGRGGNYTARDLTAAGGAPLMYNHANMKLNRISRDRKLSQLTNGLAERHTGVLITNHVTGEGGYIVPDRLNFDTIQFRNTEIQATGSQRLDRLSEVEFYVRPGRYENQMDRALCITRRGGGLITAERKETGCRRRLLGSMYNINDIKARVPQEFRSNRQLGYVMKYEREKNYAFVLPFNDPTNTIFVHLDDCHIYGARYLNRFQCLEYIPIRDENTGKTKALHVTGPQQTVLKSCHDNRYTLAQDCIHDFEVDTGERILGHVIICRRGVNWFIIKPEKTNYRTLLGFKNNIRAMGNKQIQVGDAVEFEVTVPWVKSTDDPNREKENDICRAINISAPNNHPFICEFGLYGSYLQSKFNVSVIQSELEECEPSSHENDLKDGYICNFNSERKFGIIEIEAPAGERYRKVLFKWSDCILDSNLDPNKVYLPRTGNKVQCLVENIEEGDETFDDPKNEFRKEKFVHRKAVSVVTQGLNALNVREVLKPRFAQREIEDEESEETGPLAIEIGDDEQNEETDELDFLKN